MKPIFPILLSGSLAACAIAPLPETAAVSDLKFIAYQNSRGERILPVARSVPQERLDGWQNWLADYRSGWQPAMEQTVSGATLWCAQWQQGGRAERVCNRGGHTLVWLGRALHTEAAAVRAADAVWYPPPAAPFSGSRQTVKDNP